MKWIYSLILCFTFIQVNAHECFHASASVLFLDTCQSSLDYALKGVPEFIYLDYPTYIGAPPFRGNKHYLDYNWDSGFRLNVELKPNCSSCSLAFSWMSFDTVGADSVKESGEKIIYPILIHPDRTTTNRSAESAKGKNALRLDTYDFLLQSTVQMDSCTILVPKIGLRIAEIDQALKVDYINTTDRFLTDRNDSIRVGYHSDLEGVGVLLGVKTEFMIGCGFGAHIDAAGFLLTCEFDTHHKELFTGSGDTIVDVKGHQCAPEWGFDISAGLNWKRQCGAACIVFGLSYEFHEWLQVPQVSQYYSNAALASGSEFDGHLTLHGVAFTGSIEF